MEDTRTPLETFLFPEESPAHNITMKDYLDSLTEEEREKTLNAIRGE